MAKKIAIIVRERQGEALRMAVGATLADDEINVFIMDRKLEPDAEMKLNLETLTEMIGVPIFTNNPENPYKVMSTEEIGEALAHYDLVIPY